MTRLHAVVLAGGGGSRLWPISRRRRPKQVLRLSAERSLFAESIARLSSWLPAEQITVATTPVLADLLAQEAPDLPRSCYLLEPEPKGTAPVLGLAAVVVRQQDPQAVLDRWQTQQRDASGCGTPQCGQRHIGIVES